jgi:hypothetical protein
MTQLIENKRRRPILIETFSGGLASAPDLEINPLPGGNPGCDGGIRLHRTAASIRGRRGPPGTAEDSSTQCLEIVNDWYGTPIDRAVSNS